ncbi:MAG: gephyrin-like molybdotransferase Glp [Myxococcota bacterium]
MIAVDEALELIASAVDVLEAEWVDLSDALGRVTANAARARVSLPPFAQSAMDGYALRSRDVRGVGEGDSIRLDIVGEVRAGPSVDLPEVGSGQAVRIFTGAQLPPGADAVIRQERAERDGDDVLIRGSVEPGNDIRPVGEELAVDTKIVSAGMRLDERHLAALSMTGHEEVHVRRRPRVALIVSGDEVVEPGRALSPGEIYDANTPFLRGFLQRSAGITPELIKVQDDRDEVRRQLDRALSDFDLVVSTGGVSVGDYDFLTQVSAEVGAEEVFWKVRQKPGKPVFFSVRDGTPFLGLPGNPGAVFVGAHAYLARAIDGLVGGSRVRPYWKAGRLAGPLDRSGSRARWAPCRLEVDADGVNVLEPIERGRAHRMSQLYRADALVLVSEGEGEVVKGARVLWCAVG